MKELDNGYGGIACDCCDEPVLSREFGQDFESEDTESKNILNDKFLIIIGLALTAAIVILELTISRSFITGFVTFVLATPVQFLLGKQFYIRFFMAIKNKKRIYY